MNAHTARQLIDRALAVLATRRPEMPDRYFEQPVAHYLDAARLARERALHARHPQPIAAAAELARPGDWVARDRAGVPFLLMRGDDGVARAFLNVCRHRGARLVPPGHGSGRDSVSCPYHAWNYGLDGGLRRLPQAFGFPGLDRAAHGLRPLAAAERCGLIWVIPDPARAGDDVEALLGPLADELDALGLPGHVPLAPRALPVAANWKLLVDGSFEAYHFQIAHRATIASMFPNNVQVIDEFGLNRRLFLPKSVLTPEAVSGDELPAPRLLGNILYFFFPNTMLLVQGDYAQLSSLEPLDTGHTLVHELALIPEAPATEKAIGFWDRNLALYRAALGEDYALAESIQSGLASGANQALTFGGYEFAAARFHEQLERCVDSESAAS